MGIMKGIRLKAIHEGVGHLMWTQYRIMLKDMSIYDDPSCFKTLINIMVYREGSVYSGYMFYQHEVDRVDIYEDSISIRAGISDIPKIIWQKYKIKQMLELRA